MYYKTYATFAYIISMFALVCVALPGVSSAADASKDPASIAGVAIGAAPPAGTVSCFDYYTFGSVQAHLTASVSGTVSGTPITFRGTLENTNPYPIVDGALYVKVFRDRSGKNDGNGPDVVDQFLVKGDIVIPAKSSVPAALSWRVPAYAMSGEYRIATFFTTSRKFNLLGLTFTDDVVGNTVPFSVSGENADVVQFDKAGEKVDGTAYHFAAFPPRVSKDAPVVVSATIKNPTAEVQNATVSWQVNQWDAQLRQNVVQEESTAVKVPAHGTAPVSITVTDAKYPVYLVVGTMTWKDTKSVIGVRFVRDGVDRTRINFPGVMSYPLKAGAENTLFSCLHNAGASISVPKGRLDLTLTDSAGALIHQYSYEGDVTGAMMGVADTFTPTRDYDKFTLDARLYSDGQYIDEAHLVYDCATIDPSHCVAQDAAVVVTPADTIREYLNLGFVGLGLMLVLLAIGLVWRRFRKVPQSASPTYL